MLCGPTLPLGCGEGSALSRALNSKQQQEPRVHCAQQRQGTAAGCGHQQPPHNTHTYKGMFLQFAAFTEGFFILPSGTLARSQSTPDLDSAVLKADLAKSIFDLPLDALEKQAALSGLGVERRATLCWDGADQPWLGQLGHRGAPPALQAGRAQAKAGCPMP